MTEVMLIAMQDGHFRPNSIRDAEIIRKHWKPGELALLELRKPRNEKFHRKLFALLNFLYEYWEPAVTEHKGIPIQKNFDKFREDITIAAGFREIYANAITGELRLKAKSISFANMDDVEFEALYNAILDIGLQRILPQTFGKDDVDKAIEEQLLGFM